MTSSKALAQKRLNLAYNQVERFRGLISGAFLAGSTVYAPNTYVTPKSDVDIVLVARDIRKSIDLLIEDENPEKQRREREALRKRVFEGYCIKNEAEGIEVSIHVLSEDALDVISKGFVGDLRLYRSTSKSGDYILHGFSGQTYNYWIKNIPLPDLSGGRTIIPFSFVNNDRYFMGIHRDKMLCTPKVLYDPCGVIRKSVDKLWDTVTKVLYSESMRMNGSVDLKQMSILNAMAKKDKFEEPVIRHIKERTQDSLKRVTG